MSSLNPTADPRLARVAFRPGRRERRRLIRAVRRGLNLKSVPLLARICLVVLFPFSGLDKIVHRKHALEQADSSIVPPAAGPSMLVVAALVEFIAPVCIAIGWHDRLAAFILAGFCVVTAFLFHPFWQYPNFWSPSDTEGNSHFWEFLKNFGLVGGLLLVVIGGGFVPTSSVVEHPLSSAPMSANPVAPAEA